MIKVWNEKFGINLNTCEHKDDEIHGSRKRKGWEWCLSILDLVCVFILAVTFWQKMASYFLVIIWYYFLQHQWTFNSASTWSLKYVQNASVYKLQIHHIFYWWLICCAPVVTAEGTGALVWEVAWMGKGAECVWTSAREKPRRHQLSLW